MSCNCENYKMGLSPHTKALSLSTELVHTPIDFSQEECETKNENGKRRATTDVRRVERFGKFINGNMSAQKVLSTKPEITELEMEDLLRQCCVLGSIEKFESLQELSGNMAMTTRLGEFLFYTCCRHGHQDLAVKILEQNERNYNGSGLSVNTSIAFLVILDSGNVEMLKWILKLMNLFSRNEGCDKFFIAIFNIAYNNNHQSIVAWVITHMIDIYKGETETLAIFLTFVLNTMCEGVHTKRFTPYGCIKCEDCDDKVRLSWQKIKWIIGVELVNNTLFKKEDFCERIDEMEKKWPECHSAMFLDKSFVKKLTNYSCDIKSLVNIAWLMKRLVASMKLYAFAIIIEKLLFGEQNCLNIPFIEMVTIQYRLNIGDRGHEFFVRAYGLKNYLVCKWLLEVMCRNTVAGNYNMAKTMKFCEDNNCMQLVGDVARNLGPCNFLISLVMKVVTKRLKRMCSRNLITEDVDILHCVYKMEKKGYVAMITSFKNLVHEQKAKEFSDALMQLIAKVFDHHKQQFSSFSPVSKTIIKMIDSFSIMSTGIVTLSNLEMTRNQIEIRAEMYGNRHLKHNPDSAP